VEQSPERLHFGNLEGALWVSEGRCSRRSDAVDGGRRCTEELRCKLLEDLGGLAEMEEIMLAADRVS
jgi:hypothetical protein